MKAGTRSYYRDAVQQSVEDIIRSLDQALDLNQLAKRAALSPFHFHRIFRGMLGETPLEMHRRLRMERAAWLLLSSDTPITSLAFFAGYETHESFTRAFRKYFMCSPQDFRNRLRQASRSCERTDRIEISVPSGVHYVLDTSDPIAIHYLDEGQNMEVQIKEVEKMRVACVEHVGPYNQISTAFARLGELAGPAGLFSVASGMVGLYYDDPESTPAADLRADAGLVVSGECKIPKGLRERWIDAGTYACTVHIGPHTQLGDVWARFLGGWLPQSGYRMADTVSFEMYRNSPQDTDPAKLCTELYIPLVKG